MRYQLNDMIVRLKQMRFKKSIISLSLISLSTLIVGCISEDVKDQHKGLALTNHEYVSSKTTAFKTFGFDQDSIPSGIDNIDEASPTEFKVKLYVGDNKDCKVIYIASDDGTKSQETKTAEFKAYLSPRDTLVKVVCAGKDSNIDYKITAVANKVTYTRIGNLSYMAEASEF